MQWFAYTPEIFSALLIHELVVNSLASKGLNRVLQVFTQVAPEDLEHAVDRLALAMPLATRDQPFGPEHTVYRVGGKIFAMYTEGIGHPIVNLKTDPEESEVLRRIYPSIIPAWHMNKRHWISVGAGEGITERVLEELVEDAYLRVMYSLPKAKRPIEFRERPVPEKH